MKLNWDDKEIYLKKLNHHHKVHFALFCANQVKDIWKDIPEAVQAIRITELWLEGKASQEECRVAANASANAGAHAAAHAANATAYTHTVYPVYAAINAASINSIFKQKQMDFLYQLLNLDYISETYLLG